MKFCILNWIDKDQTTVFFEEPEFPTLDAHAFQSYMRKTM